MANRWLAPGLWRETVSPVDAPPGANLKGRRRQERRRTRTRSGTAGASDILPWVACVAIAPRYHAMLDSAVGGRSPPEGGKASWAIGSGWDGDSKAAPGSRSFWVLPAEGDQMRRGVGMHATRREQAAARPLRFTAQTGGGQDQRSWWRGQLGGAARPLRFTAQTGGGQDQRSWWRGQLGGAAAFGQHAWRRAMAGAAADAAEEMATRCCWTSSKCCGDSVGSLQHILWGAHRE